MPEEMKAEGYVIIPDGKGLAITAASAQGIFYALQTVKQLVEAYPGHGGGAAHGDDPRLAGDEISRA